MAIHKSNHLCSATQRTEGSPPRLTAMPYDIMLHQKDAIGCVRSGEGGE